MADVPDLLAATVEDILRRELGPEQRREADREGWSPALWQRFEEAGLTAVGWDAGPAEVAAVVRATARQAAPIPLAETAMLAAWVLAEAGLEPPSGPLTAGWFEDGAAAAVPYARQAATIVALSTDGAALLTPDLYSVTAGVNYAGEPRDGVRVLGRSGSRQAGPERRAFEERGALVRALEISGALESVLELTVTHARDRRQFGSPLLRFQAIQEQVAVLAEEVVAARASVDAALESGRPDDVAAAKIRTGMAAGIAVRIAHQVHGAIGYTEEHVLHNFTRRLLSWRDEFGTEYEWASRLGAALPVDGFWEVSVDR